MKKTTFAPVSAPQWLLIDADGQTIGRVAARSAYLLRGKHKPTFSGHQLCGDHVIVLNAGKLSLPPAKGQRKVYYKHTGYVGHVKVASLDQMIQKNPQWVIEEAIFGMLPKNSLRPRMMKRLHVFAENEHPYAARKPLSVPPLA